VARGSASRKRRLAVYLAKKAEEGLKPTPDAKPRFNPREGARHTPVHVVRVVCVVDQPDRAPLAIPQNLKHRCVAGHGPTAVANQDSHALALEAHDQTPSSRRLAYRSDALTSCRDARHAIRRCAGRPRHAFTSGGRRVGGENATRTVHASVTVFVGVASIEDDTFTRGQGPRDECLRGTGARITRPACNHDAEVDG
jgi:hypothetical protein